MPDASKACVGLDVHGYGRRLGLRHRVRDAQVFLLLGFVHYQGCVFRGGMRCRRFLLRGLKRLN